jgi:uncharacterized protein YndB with AHSA1/START domain
MIDKTIELEVEVPGTPEEVWQSIATGPGITTWFVPSEVDERVGGTITQDFGPGMGTASGQVTGWEPPRRFVYEANGVAGRPLAYEWLVESRSAGMCLVRLVTSGFLSEADWQAEYDATFDGWKLFLYNLKLARTHFPGQRCASILVNGMTAQSPSEAWRTLIASLGLPETPIVGQQASASVSGGPAMSGKVEQFDESRLTLLLDRPTGGVGFIAAEGFGQQVWVTAYLYLFGDAAPPIVERDEPGWRAWMESTFKPAVMPA